MNWRDDLLSGITTLPQFGRPGKIVVFGDHAQPIMTGETEEDIFIAAAQFGQGRVVVFALEKYAERLFEQEPASGDDAVATLKWNVKRWIISNGVYGGIRDVVDLSDRQIGESELSAAKVATYKGGSAGQIDSARLLEFIRDGGGFLISVTPWGWRQKNSGKALEKMPYCDVLKAVGLYYTTATLSNKPSRLVAENKAAGAHLVTFLNMHFNISSELLTNAAEYFSSVYVAQLVRSLDAIPRDLPNEMEIKSIIVAIWNFTRTRISGDWPSRNSLTTSKGQVDLMNIWLACVEHIDVDGPMGIKSPGCGRFPGDFSIVPPLENITVEYSAHMEDIFPTGVYAPAGQFIEVEVLSDTMDKKWAVIVGAHTDILTKDKLSRWPKIHVEKKVSASSSYRFSTPFGGLIYLKSPNQKNCHIRVKISNVVFAPQFVLSEDASNETANEAAVSAWSTSLDNPGLWVDIIGRHIIITLPRDSASGVDDPSEAVRLWDQVIGLYHELRGTDVNTNRREWVVTDQQPSIGNLHAGYPIVTQLNIADPHKPEFILNTNGFRTAKAFWGVFHEIGHNMQRNEWTFEGTKEVTVNIFTLYAMDSLCGFPPWIHEWLQGHQPRTIEYLVAGADFEKWKSSAGVALFIYAQLARDFGWNAYRSVFRRYEAMTVEQKKALSHNQKKIDEWYFQFSEVTNRSLAPLAQFWGIPLSTEAVSRMAGFATYLPDDEITQAVAERTNSVILSFPGISRSAQAVE